MGETRPLPRGTATFLAAGCLLVVALAAVLLVDHPWVNLIVLLMIGAIGVLALVGAALYLIGGPRRPVRPGRVMLLWAGLPALALAVVALVP